MQKNYLIYLELNTTNGRVFRYDDRCPRTIAIQFTRGDRYECSHNITGKKTWKKCQAFRPTTFSLPVQCSPNAVKSRSRPVFFFHVFLPVVVWLHSHLSSRLNLIATVGHLLQLWLSFWLKVIFLTYDQVQWRLRPVTSFQDIGTSLKLEVIQQTLKTKFHHISEYWEESWKCDT